MKVKDLFSLKFIGNMDIIQALLFLVVCPLMAGFLPFIIRDLISGAGQ